MTLSDLANLGTLASAIAVLASLGYLSVQVRQTEKNQRALLNQAIATRSVDALRWRAEERVAALVARVESGEVDFTPTELTQLTFMLRVTVAQNQDSHLQHAVGLVDRRTLEMTQGGLRSHLRWPLFRALWSIVRVEFPGETAGLVDQVMAATPLAQPRDLSAELKRQLSAVSAP